jgi:hypothetical protein
LARWVRCACQCSQQIALRSHYADFALVNFDALSQCAQVVTAVAAAVETDALTGGLGGLSQHFRRYGLLAGVPEHRLCPYFGFHQPEGARGAQSDRDSKYVARGVLTPKGSFNWLGRSGDT